MKLVIVSAVAPLGLDMMAHSMTGAVNDNITSKKLSSIPIKKRQTQLMTDLIRTGNDNITSTDLSSKNWYFSIKTYTGNDNITSTDLSSKECFFQNAPFAI